MNYLRTILVPAWTLAVLLLISARAGGSEPSYILLQPPPQAPYHAPNNAYGGAGFTVDAPRYSYGWFGAPSRRHYSRQFGYYRIYTQWTYR